MAKSKPQHEVDMKSARVSTGNRLGLKPTETDMNKNPQGLLEGMYDLYEVLWARNSLVEPEVRRTDSGICIIALTSGWRFHFLPEGDNFSVRSRQNLGSEHIFTVVRGDTKGFITILDNQHV